MKELVQKIENEIENRGIISFAEFMRFALYCPNLGFYEKDEDKIGRRGAFYTSVSVGELFGQLLGFQFSEWFEQAEWMTPVGRQENALQIVEAGSHRGDLAKDVLGWLKQNRPRIFPRVEYCLVEPSARLRKWQVEALAGFQDKVRWVSDFEQLRDPGVRGVIFSNELLDAMPLHRVMWHRASRTWRECGVSMEKGRFAWAMMKPEQALNVKSTWLSRLPEALLDLLPDRFTVEISLEAESWWADAARVLRRGRLMTIDYGFATEELLAPERNNGTLRAYYDHRVNSDVLANPGDQDLTAHVNFSALQNIGSEKGLVTELFNTQSHFLTGILSRMRDRGDVAERWDSSRTRQFQTLTNPDFLGRAFRVLVQSRMVAAAGS